MKKKKILILGSTGMLGSMILSVLEKEKSFVVSATTRNKNTSLTLKKQHPSVAFYKFDALNDSFSKLIQNTGPVDWIINAIGIIKPLIHDENMQEVERAIKVNAQFPFHILSTVSKKKTRIIQIKKGNYSEKDLHDPLDVYGKTKSLGEVLSPQFFLLRSSIIGPEKGRQNLLLEWFLSQKDKAVLSGYTNHSWNGITTLHFAKICKGIILRDLSPTSIQHIIPKDIVTKEKLLKYFTLYFDRKDIRINPVKAKTSVDRTLNTIHVTINTKLWKSAGYKNSPTIEEMVKELSQYRR